MPVHELTATQIPREQVHALEQFAATLNHSELRDLLDALVSALRQGTDVALTGVDTEFTPTEAAKHLKMSRTHLYKLLDRGDIEFHRVGRDRRIPVQSLITFEAARQRDRRELAERFAHRDETRRLATRAVADEL